MLHFYNNDLEMLGFNRLASRLGYCHKVIVTINLILVPGQVVAENVSKIGKRLDLGPKHNCFKFRRSIGQFVGRPRS
jgi:hypothetical protein